MGKYKVNRIKTDLGSYRHYWRGERKIGKSTLFRDLINLKYGGPEGGLLISLGNETGFRAIDNVIVEEAKNWKRLLEIKDDLVKNKQDNEFQIIGLDTVDELVAICSDEAMRIHQEKTGKSAKSVNEIFGGYGAGNRWITEQINNVISELEGAGYGLIFIGHTKLRDIKETPDSDAYQQLTSNLSDTYDGIFADKADILATFHTRKVVKDNKLESQERYIFFRDNGFIACGTRFPKMPESVKMTAENYLWAFEEGVRGAFMEQKTPEEIEAIRKQEIEERNQAAQQYIQIESKSDDEIKKEIIKIGKELGGSDNDKLMYMLKKYEPENGNPMKITERKALVELLGNLLLFRKNGNI